MNSFLVALCGNPNVGKSTVFNALTGMKQHTGNWTGKTVESAAGTVTDGTNQWELIDLPGAYSLFSGSPEEIVASDYLALRRPDAVIVVCDAVCLERNLNLALQIAQVCPNTLLCINMMDEARKRKITINTQKLNDLLEIPVMGICARTREGLDELKRQVWTMLLQPTKTAKVLLPYPPELAKSLQTLSPLVPDDMQFALLRCLAGEQEMIHKLEKHVSSAISAAIENEKKRLFASGLTQEKITRELITASYQRASEICTEAVSKSSSCTKHATRQLALDRLLCSRSLGIPIMLLLLAVVLYLTIIGANVPSAWLSSCLSSFEPHLERCLLMLGLPAFLVHALTSGVYRVTCWVISVMLPPMAIFFPLFTFLENLGFLPRVAFNLDKCFQRCHACGKQALCMCMGLGCNAVGITGCRIIQSPRERLIAILTNSFMPCNGRFPTLIALCAMFFGISGGIFTAMALSAMILFSILATLGCSFLLSKTLLRGMASSFALELPPFRRPKVAETMIRSVFDRTLFVLGRAVSVAAPAGLLVWLLANIDLVDRSVLTHLAGWLDPAGRMLGMDGVILLAFILGFPANEIVLPLMMMIYMNHGQLVALYGLDALRELFVQNGWTTTTALCVLTFMLFHWPCSTTVLTIRKETRSLRWTIAAVLLPTFLGGILCILIRLIAML